MNTTIIQEPTEGEAVEIRAQIDAPLAEMKRLNAETVAPKDSIVRVDDKGIARITGTRIKVAQIAQEHTRLGWTREQIVSSHPHLSLTQVSAALEFYESHREVIDAQISAALAYAETAQWEAKPSALAAKLRTEKRRREQQAA